MRESKKLRLLCLAALFAGAIAVTTAYLLHIPIPTGGYIHLGDALIYLAACLLPAPYAVGAAMVGAGLADLLTAPLWVVPTLLIKAMVADGSIDAAHAKDLRNDVYIQQLVLD